MSAEDVSTFSLSEKELETVCLWGALMHMCVCVWRLTAGRCLWKASFSNLTTNYIIACAPLSATLLARRPQTQHEKCSQREDAEAGKQQRGRWQESRNKGEHFWLLMTVNHAYTHLLWCQSIDRERQYQRCRGGQEQKQCKWGKFARYSIWTTHRKPLCLPLCHITRLHTKEEDEKHKNALFIIHNHSCQKEGTSKWWVHSSPGCPLGFQKEPHPSLET